MPESLIVADGEGENSYDNLGPQASNGGWNREFVKLAHENEEVVDTLGQPSGKFDYFVKYSPPPNFFIDLKDVVPDGWVDMNTFIRWLSLIMFYSSLLWRWCYVLSDLRRECSDRRHRQPRHHEQIHPGGM